MSPFAIILAAGRGSRMYALTANRPKCLLPLAGKALLEWQEEALLACGVAEIHIVRGYRGESLPPRFSFSDNPRWQETNMLYSLACASGFVNKGFDAGLGPLLISYADIVYSPVHVRKLLAAPGDIVLTYDTLWQKLWELRFDDVLADAETFREEDGRLMEIGGRPNAIAEIAGQYMGLIKLTEAGWREWSSVVSGLGPDIDKTDMTSFLRLLLSQGCTIGAIPVEGGWCEADSASDLEKYEIALAAGNWSHDWRGNS